MQKNIYINTKRQYTHSVHEAISDPLSIWFILLFILENEGIVHMGANIILDLCVPPLNLNLLGKMLPTRKRHVLRSISATKQSDILCEPVTRPAQFISINIVERTISIFQLTIINCILTLQHFTPRDVQLLYWSLHSRKVI